MGSLGISAAERDAISAAELEESAFVAYRDEHGDLRIVGLTTARKVRIGRAADNDIVLADNVEVSRAHAVLEAAGGGWTIVDDGRSRNGTFVNGHRVLRSRRLEDNDVVRVGATSILFRSPCAQGVQTTAMSGGARPRITPREERVLVELCRPLIEGDGFAVPATNQQIADALVLSVAGVKTHIRSLFAKLQVDGLPQNSKRAELARRAVDLGLVTSRSA